jgi:hypothetical protein
MQHFQGHSSPAAREPISENLLDDSPMMHLFLVAFRRSFYFRKQRVNLQTQLRPMTAMAAAQDQQPCAEWERNPHGLPSNQASRPSEQERRTM